MHYIESDQIDFKEVCKIYQALIRNLPPTAISPDFQEAVLTNYILKAL